MKKGRGDQDMNKKAWKAGAVSALAVGAGLAAAASKRKKAGKVVKSASDYRNTERGSQEKNSKGIYYSKGNYEAFARPEKPAGIEGKSAYIVGSGLASLAAACFLVRDAQMPGENIHILEAMEVAGGACDGIQDPTRGYVMRGGREMEDHFECLWDLFRSIPSLEVPGASVLDEYYWLNKHDPNYSLCRATVNRGEDAHTDGKFRLSQKGSMEIMKLFMTKDEDLYDKTIEDVFDDEVFDSTFWLYWRTMFAFENWHSALEMKLYFQRFIHHISGLPDFSALKFTKYNQYESLILPMKKYLEAAGVDFQFNTEVTNVIFDINDGKKVDEYEVNSDITKRLIVQNDFDDFDLMEIEFTKTKEPFNRIVVDYFSFGDITDFTMERQDMTSSPKSIKQELVKAVRVPCYSYQKGTAEETLISEETEATKGDVQTYYLGDPTYDCRATFNGSASNVSIIERGDYYVMVKFLITGKYQFEIIGHRYNIVEQYATKTLNSRGKTITWKNPLVSDMETANHLADWLGDYYNAGIEYEYNTRGNPEIDANDIVYQENAYRPGLKVNIYRHVVNFSQSLSGKVIARRVSEK